MTTRPIPAVVIATLLTSAAGAATLPVDIQAGSLRTAVSELARQTGSSIAVEDEALWLRPVPAVRGRLGPATALRRLLKGSGARIIAAGDHAWRVTRPRAALVTRRAPAPIVRSPAPEPDDQTIVVTASKRDTRLRDFAGAVTIIDGANLRVGGERGMDSILARLASLSSTYLGAGRNKLFIRGIADSSFTGPTQATVGQYLGDIRLTYNAPDPDLRLYDIRSVEVLEGPQGTLYGAGSLGGIIRLVPNPARLDETSAALSGGLSATQHGDPGGDLGGTINLPLARDVALRVVGYGISEGGYIDDVLRRKRDINRTTIGGGRASLRIDAGDAWTIDTSILTQHNHGHDSQYADRYLPPLQRASPTDGGFDADYTLADMVVGKTWNDLAFLSSTGIVRQHLDERYDATVPDGPDRIFLQRNRTALFTSENRLWHPVTDGFGWVVGATYTHNRTLLDRSLGPVDLPAPTTGVVNKISEITTYGEASVQPSAAITLTGGVRYAHARLSGAAEDISPTVKTLLTTTGVTGRRWQDTLLPSGSIAAQVAPGTLLFIRYQEGSRPGGLAVEDETIRRFKRDGVQSIETGLRFGPSARDPFGGAINIAYAHWSHIQADFIDGGGLPSTSNIGTGRIYSVSASLSARPTTQLVLDAAAIYNDGRVTKPSTAFLQSLINRATFSDAVAGPEVPTTPLGRIPNVAAFTGRIGFRYYAAVRDDLILQIDGWARYVGKSRLGIGPVLGGKQGNYSDTGLSARVGRPGAGVTVSVNNVFDVVGNRFAFGTPFAAEARQITPLRPRTIRLGLDRAF